jgi:hypothetical protein
VANYYGQSRTNYFKVNDPEAFKAELEKMPVEVITQPLKNEDGEVIDTLYGFLDADSNGAGYITEYWDEEANDSVEIDLEDLFKRHLADGWVAILLHSGSEKYRYISGDAVAYNNKGESVDLNLANIYGLAEALGENITTAEY